MFKLVITSLYHFCNFKRLKTAETEILKKCVVLCCYVWAIRRLKTNTHHYEPENHCLQTTQQTSDNHKSQCLHKTSNNVWSEGLMLGSCLQLACDRDRPTPNSHYFHYFSQNSPQISPCSKVKTSIKQCACYANAASKKAHPLTPFHPKAFPDRKI